MHLQDHGQGVPEIKSILSGDESAWADLYEIVLNLAKKFVRLRRINHPGQTAGEIAHDVAAKFFERHVRPENLSRFMDEGVSGYVFRMVYNWAVDFFKEQEKARELLRVEDLEDEKSRPPIFLLEECWPSELWSPERIVQFKESLEITQRAINCLSEKRKKVLRGRLWGMAHKAIAKEIGLVTSAVGQELNRAREDLLRLLPRDCVPVKENLF